VSRKGDFSLSGATFWRGNSFAAERERAAAQDKCVSHRLKDELEFSHGAVVPVQTLPDLNGPLHQEAAAIFVPFCNPQATPTQSSEPGLRTGTLVTSATLPACVNRINRSSLENARPILEIQGEGRDPRTGSACAFFADS